MPDLCLQPSPFLWIRQKSRFSSTLIVHKFGLLPLKGFRVCGDHTVPLCLVLGYQVYPHWGFISNGTICALCNFKLKITGTITGRSASGASRILPCKVLVLQKVWRSRQDFKYYPESLQAFGHPGTKVLFRQAKYRRESCCAKLILVIPCRMKPLDWSMYYPGLNCWKHLLYN